MGSGCFWALRSGRWLFLLKDEALQFVIIYKGNHDDPRSCDFFSGFETFETENA